MANPQLEEGYIAFACELGEAFAKTNLSPYEHRVLWAIARKTYGWRKKQDRISYSQLVEITALKRQHIARSLNSLIARNIVYRRGEGYRIQYGIQKDYSKWTRSLPAKVTNKTSVTSKGNGFKSLPAEVKPLPPKGTKSLPAEGHTKATKASIQKQDILRVFNHWNKTKIIVHPKLTPAMESELKKVITEYDEPQVIIAITNYGRLVNGDYTWTFKWTLAEFCSRAHGNNIERFRDMEVLKQNYGRKTNAINGIARKYFEEGRTNTYSDAPHYKD